MKRILLSLVISVFFTYCYSQNVGIGTNNPNPNAALDIQSDSRGLLIPRMDSNARKAIAHVKGLLVYDTTTSSFWFSNGIGWLKSMASNGRQNLIEDGSNPGEMLYWNGTRWVTVDAGQQNQLLYFCNGAPAWGGCKPIVSTADVTSITTTSAAGGGNITNEGTAPVTARGIVWSTTENPTVDLTTKTNDGSGTGSFTSNITGLSINTTYYVRSYATNANGTAYGNQVSFTTPNVDITTGLVAYYPFNGNANDESGNGNNGTVNGTINYSPDRNNTLSSAAQLGSGYITANRSVFEFQRNQPFSVSFWFTKDNSGDGGRLISTECGTGFSGAYYGNFRIGAGPGGSYALQYGDYIFDEVVLNTWNHLVYTHVNGEEKVYINGILKYTNIETAYEPLVYCAPFTIGAKSTASFDKWVGKIDELRIHNRILTQEEVTHLATH